MRRANVAAGVVGATAMALAFTGCPSLQALDNTSQADAATDAGSEVTRGDGAGHGPVDSPVDVDACDPIAVSDASVPPPSNCSLSDGSTCSPGPISGFSPTWIPPRKHASSCTAQQISDYYAACLANGGSPANCNAFVLSQANQGCMGCILSNSTDSELGPTVIDDGYYLFVNVAGCIALLDPCNIDCAEATLFATLCEHASCFPVCPKSIPVVNPCLATADTCPCQQYEARFLACHDAIRAAATPAAACLASDPAEAFAAIGAAFCLAP